MCPSRSITAPAPSSISRLPAVSMSSSVKISMPSILSASLHLMTRSLASGMSQRIMACTVSSSAMLSPDDVSRPGVSTMFLIPTTISLRLRIISAPLTMPIFTAAGLSVLTADRSCPATTS